MALLRERLQRGRISEDGAVRAPVFRRAVQSYVWSFSQRSPARSFRCSHLMSYEDLISVCSLALLKALQDFDALRGVALLTFCTLCMHRACRRALQSAQRGLPKLLPIQIGCLEEEPLQNHRALTTSDRSFDVADLRIQIGQLPLALGRALNLHFLQGFTLEEIGGLLNPVSPVPKATVNHLVQRALRELRRQLEVRAPPPRRRAFRPRLSPLRGVLRNRLRRRLQRWGKTSGPKGRAPG